MLSKLETLLRNSSGAVRNYLRGEKHEAQLDIYRNYIGLLRKREAYTERTSIFEFDWDVCIILDACRPDALKYFQNNYDWLKDVNEYTPVAGRTDQWMEATFTSKQKCEDLTYISSNPYSLNHLNDDWFSKIIHLTESEWDETYNTVPARAVTDAAIRSQRDSPPGRMIVHYMQPHFPSIPSLDDETPAKSFGRGGLIQRWGAVHKEDLTNIDVVESYLANLEYVLSEVDLLLNNMEADRVLITSDHGTCLGEWSVYGHAGLHLPQVFSVPKVDTKSTDNKKHTPPNVHRDVESASDVEDKLEALGYVR